MGQWAKVLWAGLILILAIAEAIGISESAWCGYFSVDGSVMIGVMLSILGLSLCMLAISNFISLKVSVIWDCH